jgi:signal transduction histidine kinase
VNHELRTPLTSIRSCSEILRDNPELDAQNPAAFYDIIIRETERLTRLINQMLDLAQIQSGQIAAVVMPVDLGEVVAEAIAATDRMMREKGISVRVAGAPAVVLADRDLLMQILLNLLSNAAKFCPAEAGRVSIAFGPDGDAWAELAVADNGPGIAPELREAVFDRFRQIGDAASGKPMGSGLGLTICRSIVARLGGSIRIDDAVGGGARFWVRLPAVAGEAETVGRKSAASSANAT